MENNKQFERIYKGFLEAGIFIDVNSKQFKEWIEDRIKQEASFVEPGRYCAALYRDDEAHTYFIALMLYRKYRDGKEEHMERMERDPWLLIDDPPDYPGQLVYKITSCIVAIHDYKTGQYIGIVPVPCDDWKCFQ